MEDKVKYIIDKLKSLQRYESYLEHDCNVMWKEREGDYVQWDDIEDLINEIENR